MDEIKTIECHDGPANPTGVYLGEVPPKDAQRLMVGDIALLSCSVPVLVDVMSIDGDDITGKVRGFENTDADSINGVALGDVVRFKPKKVQNWHRS